MKTSDKVVALLGIVIGGLASLFELLVAFGVNITPDQQTAISGVAGVVLLAVSAWFHPAVPLGRVEPSP